MDNKKVTINNVPALTEKHCPKCVKTKTASEFSKCRQQKSGLQVYCRACRSAKAKFAWRAKNLKENEKQCLKCREIKTRDQFRRDESKKDGLHPYCKSCKKIQDEAYQEKNIERIKESGRKYRIATREMRRIKRIPLAEKLNEKKRKWNRINKDRIREYAIEYSKNEPREQKLARYKRTYSRNRDKLIKKSVEKYQNDIKYRLQRVITSSINSRFRRNRVHDCSRLFSHLPYTVDSLIKHIQKQFKPGMTWGNYGRVWELDHIIPAKVFNFKSTDDIDFLRCWSLGNLRPLDKHHNRTKSAKLTMPFQPSLLISVNG